LVEVVWGGAWWIEKQDIGAAVRGQLDDVVSQFRGRRWITWEPYPVGVRWALQERGTLIVDTHNAVVDGMASGQRQKPLISKSVMSSRASPERV
jgi:hypothetical protein